MKTEIDTILPTTSDDGTDKASHLPGGKPLYYMPETEWHPDTPFLVGGDYLPGLNF